MSLIEGDVRRQRSRNIHGGQSLLRILMNEVLSKVDLVEPVIDFGGGRTRSGYQDLIPSFSATKVWSFNLFAEDDVDLLCDFESMLPLRSQSLRTALAFNLLEHLYNPWSFLDEMQRVLLPEGRFYAVTPFLYRVHGDPQDYWRFTSHAWERMLRERGFDDICIVNLGDGPFDAAYGLIEWVSPRFLRPLVYALH